MNGLEMRAQRIGERAARRLRDRVAAALHGELGDAVREGEGGVTIEGARAAARMWSEPALRWIAGLIR